MRTPREVVRDYLWARDCNCGNIWCHLDTLFVCRWKYACDKHDKRILGE